MKVNDFNKGPSRKTLENVQSAPYNKPSKVRSVSEEPIYGVKENSRWAKRLQKTNPAAYSNLKNWD